MKKILFILSFICVAFAASSFTVSEQTAAQMASRFFGGFYVTNSSSVTLVSNGLSQATKSTQDAAPYYIFNHEGGGYVIIAGDDAMKPVIGYSYTGHIDINDMSDNLQWWLNNVSTSIDHIRDNGIMPTKERLVEWSRVGLSTKAGATPVVNLQTVEWNQGTPFSWNCPPNAGNYTTTTHSVAGCVPIAVCELMVYYGWPVKGVGTTPAYTGSNYSVEANTLGTEYDWTILKQVYVDTNGTVHVPSSGKMAQLKDNKKVAQLVGDVGKSLQADYGLNGTSAQSENIVRLFTQYFGYNKAARFLCRGSYGDAQWESMLKAELDKSRPVLYSGQSDEGGHQFIFDGYDSNSYFHINWGWGRSYNGYFWINYDFKHSQTAVFDFVPDETGTSVLAPGDIRIIRGNDAHDGYVLTAPAAIEKNVSFTMAVGSIANFSSNIYSKTRAMRLARVDVNGTFKEWCSATARVLSSNLSPGSYYPSAFTFSTQKITDYALGDKIVLYRQDADPSTGEALDTWSPVDANKDGSILTSYPIVRNEFIDVKDSYKVGEEFETTLSAALTPYAESSVDSSCKYTSRWKFYKDGELKANYIKGVGGTYFTLSEAGNWTVVATVYVNGQATRSISTSFVVK